MKKRILSILMVLTMVLTLIPAFAITASAEEEGVKYRDPVFGYIGIDHWDEKTVDSYTVIDSSNKLTTLGAESTTTWYVVKGAVDYTNDGATTTDITVHGNVNMILCDGATLTATGSEDNAGINVTGSNSLTIYSQKNNTGTLIATGAENCAGIGGNSSESGDNGAITINGGKITAKAGRNAAGIGSGYYYSSGGDAEDITINGGTVNATGDENGAGIGSCSGGDAEDITINGGDITANGGYYGAGIGSGYGGDAKYITINGGTVNATGGSDAAGIGCSDREARDITINGGDITARGFGKGAGIGGAGNGKDIKITGGTVNAIGGKNGVGIGGYNTGGNIFIYGGTITASGKTTAIGGDDENCRDIKVENWMRLKADSNNPPTTIIDNTSSDDLTETLKGKSHAIIEPFVCKITACENKTDLVGERYVAIDEALTAVGTNAATIQMIGNVDLKESIVIASDTDIILDLNDKTIDCKAKQGVHIEAGGKLTLEDNAPYKSQVSGNYPEISSEDITTTGGRIASAYTASNNGGGVFNEGTFVMKGGNIVGCSSMKGGGGVYTTGIFEMKGGSITACIAAETGGGVLVGTNGTFTMSGGEIGYCLSLGFGAGIAGEPATGTNIITLQGGNIRNNTSRGDNVAGGGGVYAAKGCVLNVEDKDCKIVNNIATSTNYAMGGGILVMFGTVNVKDGSISDNTVSGSTTAMGGGIAYTAGKLTITGGTISGNKVLVDDGDESVALGGGVCNYTQSHPTEKVIISGCTISDNSIECSRGSMVYGGGIANMLYEMSISNCSIKGNKALNAGGVLDYVGKGTTISGKVIVDNNTLLDGKTLSNFVTATPMNLNTLSDDSLIGVTLLVEDGDLMVPGTGAFTTNGTATDIQYFFSDNDKYYVLHNKDHLELAELTVKLATATNGNIAVDNQSAATGTDVVITATPSDGYVLGKITVKDASNTDIDVVATGTNGKFTFTMPTDTDLLPVTVSATFNKPVCFVDSNGNGSFDSDETKYVSIGNAIGTSKPASESESTPTNIVLIADVEETVTIPTGRNITLNLNGHVLKADLSDGKSHSVISNEGTLTIKDSGETTKHYFKVSSTNLWEMQRNYSGTADYTFDSINGLRKDGATATDIPASGSNIAVSGGCITGGTGSKIEGSDIFGGGIYNAGTLTLQGGNIVGNNINSKSCGGGIYNAKGRSFTMSAGSIIGNTTYQGAGVFNKGIFKLEGGIISTNNASESGGGVYNNDEGKITMTGGTVSHNKAKNLGGGIVNGGSMIMTGGTISDNIACYLAGGVMENGQKFLLGGTAKIIDNTVGTAKSNLLLVKPNVTLGTKTNISGEDNGVDVPAEGMSVGVTLLDASSYDPVPGPGNFTTNGTPTDIKYFFSDNDKYYVLHNTDHLELAEITVKLATATNGNISVDKQGAATGTDVVITATPTSGYELEEIIVKASGSDIPIATGTNSPFTFTMPTDTNLLPVTVSATFKAKANPTPTPAPTPDEPTPTPVEPTPTPTPEVTAKEAFAVSGTSKGSTNTIKWNAVEGADGYEVYFAKCGKSVKLLKSTTELKCVIKKLDPKHVYKYQVKAYKMDGGEKTYLDAAATIHIAGSKAKYSNATKVTVNKAELSMKVGETAKLTAKIAKKSNAKAVLWKGHVSAKIRYKSTDESVVTVDKNGNVKAVGTGEAYVYAYAANGICAKSQITVESNLGAIWIGG